MSEITNCKFCGSDQPTWLTLDISKRQDGAAFRLYATSRGAESAATTFSPKDRPVEKWHVCRFGHLSLVTAPARAKSQALWARALRRALFPAGVTATPPGIDELPNVVRLLGSTGGGKSQIVRALRQEVLPPPVTQTPTDLRGHGERLLDREPRQEEGARMHSGTLLATADFKESVRERLQNFLADHNDGLPATDELERVLLDALATESGDETSARKDELDWGKTRAPYLLISELRSGLERVSTVTSLIDLPGEMIDRLMGINGTRLSQAESEQLKFSHQFLAVVDVMGLSGLYARLNEPERLGSLRYHTDGTGAQHVEAHAQAVHLLTDVLHMRTRMPALKQAKVTIALSKCDAVRRALSKSAPASAAAPLSRWAWVDKGGLNDRLLIQPAADTLTEIAGRGGKATPEALKILQRIQSTGDDDHVARQVAKDILTAYGEPDAFWNLVAGGQYQFFSIENTEFEMESANRYWFNGVAGYTLQVRDLVCAVIASALLGAEFGANQLGSVVADTHPYFVLTCTREFLPPAGDKVEVRDPDDPAANISRENAGILQLMSRLLQETRHG